MIASRQTRKNALKESAMLWLLIGPVMALYLLLAWVSGVPADGAFAPVPWNGMLAWTWNLWLPWLALAPAALFLGRVYPLSPGREGRFAALHLALLLVLASAHGALLGLGYLLFSGTAAASPWRYAALRLFNDGMGLFDAAIYLSIIAAGNIRRLHELAREKEAESQKLNRDLSESRLQALQMQLNPHFLFNTLNSVAVLVEKKRNRRGPENGGRIERLPAGHAEQLPGKMDFPEQGVGVDKRLPGH